ncbi:MAG: hypothetical protein JWN25_2176 [Verrucomicrobiales bacterium]|nr:hypothetical protein [Verrucomicrobiales bacterium]MDB6130229.1 hypothetical protein [Verrucomicrobiales bacterium]
MKKYRFIGPKLAVILVFSICLLRANAEITVSGAADSLPQVVLSGLDCKTFVDYPTNIIKSAWEGDKGWVVLPEIRYKTDAAQKCLVLQARVPQLRIVGAGFDGWNAVLELSNVVTLCLCKPKGHLNFKTGVDNTKPFKMFFPDGATAQVGAGSSGIFDEFKDKTYYFTGKGLITAINAEGKSVIVEGKQFPMEGGPLVSKVDAKGVSTTVRLLPSTVFKVNETENGGLTFTTAEKTFSIAKGEVKEVTFANGSVITVATVSGGFQWAVDKGEFKFSVVDVPTWTGLGLTDQAGKMIWDRTTKSVDLKNLSEEGELIVALPAGSYARIDPQAVLQYAAVGGTTFATSASGGRATLFNSNISLDTKLEQSNMEFKGGLAVHGSGGASTDFLNVNLEWASGSALNLGGSFGKAQVDPNSDKVLSKAASSSLSGTLDSFLDEIVELDPSLKVSYGDNGQIILRANVGSYHISIPSLDHLSIDVNQGDSVMLSMDHGSGILVATALGDNQDSIKVVVPNANLPVLNSSQSVTLNTRNGKVVSASSGTTVFFDNAGAGFQLSSSGGNSATPIDTSKIDNSLIIQQPVSPQ